MYPILKLTEPTTMLWKLPQLETTFYWQLHLSSVNSVNLSVNEMKKYPIIFTWQLFIDVYSQGTHLKHVRNNQREIQW